MDKLDMGTYRAAGQPKIAMVFYLLHILWVSRAGSQLKTVKMENHSCSNLMLPNQSFVGYLLHSCSKVNLNFWKSHFLCYPLYHIRQFEPLSQSPPHTRCKLWRVWLESWNIQLAIHFLRLRTKIDTIFTIRWKGKILPNQYLFSGWYWECIKMCSWRHRRNIIRGSTDKEGTGDFLLFLAGNQFPALIFKNQIHNWQSLKKPTNFWEKW